MSRSNVARTPAAGLLDGPLIFGLALAAAVALGAAVVALGDTALYGLFGLIGFCVFLRYPVAGVFVTTLLLLLVSGAAGVLGTLNAPVPVTYAKVSGFVTLVAWLTNLVVTGKPLRIRFEEGLLVAFFAWAYFGVMVSPEWRLQFPEWIRLATLVTFFVIGVHLLADRTTLHRYVILLAVCGFVMSIFAVMQYFLPAFHYTPEQLREIGAGAKQGAYVDPESLQFGAAVRVSGTSGHSNWLAFTLLLLIPLNAYWFYAAKSWVGRSLALTATGLEIAALMLTFTRTGFLVGVALVVLLGLRRLVKVSPNRLVALAAALLVGWFLLPQAYKERVLSPRSYTESSSVQHRTELMNEAIALTASNPFLGTGLGGFGINLIEQNSEVAIISRWLVEEYNWNPVFFGAHNMYLHVASETGLVGLGMLLLFMFLIIRHLRNAERLFRAAGDRQGQVLCAALMVSLISFLLCGLFLHALQQKVWWMVAAAAAVAPMIEVRPGAGKGTNRDAA